MPVQVASFLVPKNAGRWFIVEDVFVRGGFRVVPTITDRNSIHPSSRKSRMVVVTQNDGAIYQLEPDLLTWVDFRPKTSYYPFHAHEQPTPLLTWTINHNRNNRFAVPAVYDADGYVVIPDSIQSSDNVLTVRFSIPVAGFAVIAFAQPP